MPSIIKSVAFSLLCYASIAQATSIAPHKARTSSARAGYKNTFWDDFTGYAGTLPSSSKWIFQLGTSYPGGAPNWGNNEAETYTKSTSNVYISPAQNLQIVPIKTATGWTSSRIESQRTDFACTAGKKLLIESRIKLPATAPSLQQGIWPAFWALGAEFRGNYTNWPQATEWDFLEVISGGSTIYSTVHCGFAPGGPCNEYNGLGSGGVGFSRGVFHTVGFEVDRSMCGPKGHGTWKDETLTWYLDGAKVFTLKGSSFTDTVTWEKLAHQGHYLLFNVAVGGYWPGQPNEQTVDGLRSSMEVDYVGVWNSY